MKRKPYASAVTKDYLKKLGIEYVSTDGTIVIKKGKQIKISVSNKLKKSYGKLVFYDPDIYASVPKEERTKSTGRVPIDIHVLNYVWNKADKPAGRVVHHLDNNPRNNDISNLDLRTPRENVMEERKESTRELKCDMRKPRGFYEHELNKLELEYEQAKANGDADRVHKLRSYKSQYKARLRYWDSHANEHEEFICITEAKVETKVKKDNKAECIKILRKLAAEAKSRGDKWRWHNLLRAANNYDAFPEEKILEIIKNEEERYAR